MKVSKSRSSIQQNNPTIELICEVFEMRATHSNIEINKQNLETELFNEIPCFDKLQIDHIKSYPDGNEQVKVALESINYSYKFDLKKLKKIMLFSKTIFKPSVYYVSVIYHQIISYLFTNTKFDISITTLFFESLTKCGFSKYSSPSTHLFELLLIDLISKIESKECELNQYVIDAFMAYFGTTVNVQGTIYEPFVNFVHYVLECKWIDRSDQIMMLIYSLIDEKRPFLETNELVFLINVLTPFAHNFNEQSLKTLALISKHHDSSVLHDTFTLLPTIFVDFIKHNDKPLVDEQKEFFVEPEKTEKVIYFDFEFFGEKKDTSSYKMPDICFTANKVVQRLDPKVQKVIRILRSALKIASRKCVVYFYLTFTQIIDALNDGEYFYNTFAAFLSLYSYENIGEFSSFEFDVLFRKKVFNEHQSIFRESTISAFINDFRNEIVDIFIQRPKQLITDIIGSCKNNCFLLAEICFRLFLKQKLFSQDSLIDKGVPGILLKSLNEMLKMEETEEVFMAKKSIILFIIMIINSDPQKFFLNEQIAYDFLKFIFDYNLSELILSELEKTFCVCNEFDTIPCLANFLLKIIHSDYKELSTRIISIVDTVLSHNLSLANTFSYILKDIIEFVNSNNESIIHVLRIINMVSCATTKYEFPTNLKKKTIDILKNIKKTQDVVNEELRILSGSTNVELEEGFIIFRPSFLDIFTITANDEFYINALIDKFIVLANYSLSNIRKLHDNHIPYILLRSLQESFMYEDVLVELKPDPKKVLTFVQTIISYVCSPSIINVIISLIKHNNGTGVQKMFPIALIKSKSLPRTRFPIGCIKPFGKISGIPPAAFASDFSVAMKVCFDANLIIRTDVVLTLFSIDDEAGNQISVSIMRSLLYAKFISNGATMNTQISSGLPWDTLSNVLFSFTTANDKKIIMSYKNGSSFPIASCKDVVFEGPVTITFGGGVSSNSEGEEFGFISQFAIYNRALQATDVFPPDYVFNSTSLITAKTYKEVDEMRKNKQQQQAAQPQENQEAVSIIEYSKSEYKAAQNCYECFVSGNLIVKFLRAVFSTKENITNIAQHSLSVISSMGMRTQTLKHFFGIAEFISGKIINFKCASYKLYLSFVSILAFIDDNAKQEFFNSLIISVLTWLSCSFNDLKRIFDHWNNQILYIYQDLLRRRPFITKMLTQIRYAFLDQKFFTEEENEILLHKSIRFLCDASQLYCDINDAKTILAVSSTLKGRQDFFLEMFEIIMNHKSKDFFDPINKRTIKKAFMCIINTSENPNIIARLIQILMKYFFVDDSDNVSSYSITLVKSIIAKHDEKFINNLLDMLFGGFPTHAETFIFLCCFIVFSKNGKLNDCVAVFDENKELIVSNVNPNDKVFLGWFIFPLFVALHVKEEQKRSMMDIIAKIVLKSTPEEIKRVSAFAELLTSRVKTDEFLDIGSLFLNELTNEINEENEIEMLIFNRAAAKSVFRVDGPTHHDKLLKLFRNSPFADLMPADIDPRVSIMDLSALKELTGMKTRVAFWFDATDPTCSRIAAEIALKEKNGNPLKFAQIEQMMTVITKVKSGTMIPEADIIYSSYKNNFEKSNGENMAIIKKIIKQAEATIIPFKLSNFELLSKGNYITFVQDILKNAEIINEDQFIPDQTKCGPFCPMRMKLARHMHSSPQTKVQELNIFDPSKSYCFQCELIEFHKIREFHISIQQQNQNIMLSSATSTKIIPLNSITGLIKRHYCEDTVLYVELFTEGRSSFLLVFNYNLGIYKKVGDNQVEMQPQQYLQFVENEIFNAKKMPNLAMNSEDLVATHPERTASQWVCGRITTFDFLVKLNIMSGRSFSDPTAYPFIPRPFDDFETLKPSSELPQFNGSATPLLLHKTWLLNSERSDKIALKEIMMRDCIAADLFMNADSIPEEGLPEISHGNKLLFLSQIRNVLESDEVAKAIPKFVDSIWGVSMNPKFPHTKLFNDPIRQRRTLPSNREIEVSSFTYGSVLWSAVLQTSEIVIVFKSGKIISIHPSTNSVISSYDADANTTDYSKSLFFVHRGVLFELCNGFFNIYKQTMNDRFSKKTKAIEKTSSNSAYPCNFSSTGDNLIYCADESTIVCDSVYQTKIFTKCRVSKMRGFSRFDVIVYCTDDDVVHIKSMRTGCRICPSIKDFHVKDILISKELGFITLLGNEELLVLDSSGRRVGSLPVKGISIYGTSVKGEDVVFVDSESELLFVHLCDPSHSSTVNELSQIKNLKEKIMTVNYECDEEIFVFVSERGQVISIPLNHATFV